MRAENLLFETMTMAGYKYPSFPAFVEHESSIDVHDIACRAIDKAIAEERAKMPSEEMKCDACGCHPSVIITTPFGRFCPQHVRYV